MAWTLNNRLLFTAIFISGASALVYQLIWVRLLGLVFGVSSFAVATVVAVFLLGLGLGTISLALSPPSLVLILGQLGVYGLVAASAAIGPRSAALAWA